MEMMECIYIVSFCGLSWGLDAFGLGVIASIDRGLLFESCDFRYMSISTRLLSF